MFSNNNLIQINSLNNGIDNLKVYELDDNIVHLKNILVFIQLLDELAFNDVFKITEF